MRDRVAEYTQADRRIDLACNLRPFFEISECVTVGGFIFFVHSVWFVVIPSEVEESRSFIIGNSAGCFDSASLRSG